jgi:hypothetical protein
LPAKAIRVTECFADIPDNAVDEDYGEQDRDTVRNNPGCWAIPAGLWIKREGEASDHNQPQHAYGGKRYSRGYVVMNTHRHASYHVRYPGSSATSSSISKTGSLNAGFHRRNTAERLVNPAEVVVHEHAASADMLATLRAISIDAEVSSIPLHDQCSQNVLQTLVCIVNLVA